MMMSKIINFILFYYINMERFYCICGANVQLRNINNHFTTKKHINFLLNYGQLITDYKHLSKKEAQERILKKNINYRNNENKNPFVVTWD